jgi:hypothetical protein
VTSLCCGRPQLHLACRTLQCKILLCQPAQAKQHDQYDENLLDHAIEAPYLQDIPR